MCATCEILWLKKGRRRLRQFHIAGLLFFLNIVFFVLSGCYGLGNIMGSEQEQLPYSPFILPDPVQIPAEPRDVRLGFLYYADEQNRFLVPVRRAIPLVEAIAATTLLHLAPSPDLLQELQIQGLSPTLPPQTQIIGISINEGLARINFNAEFLNYPPGHERLVLGSIFCTLRQFPSINAVEILVEGEKVDRFSGGAPGRLPLGPDCYINLELDETVEDYRNFSALKLFYCYLAPTGRIFYVPVTRILPTVEDINISTVRELLIGPRKNSGLFSDIPAGTALVNFKVEKGLAVLDLSKEFLSYRGGRSGAENMVNQILLTLSVLEGIDRVQILVEGAKVTLEGLDLSIPLTPPEVYNYF